MKIKDFTQIGLYAALTATVAVAALGGRSVTSASNQPAAPQMTASVGDCKVSSTQANVPGGVRVSLATTNTTPRSTTVAFQVKVTKVDFSGNPMSRVPSPTDYKRTDVTSSATQAVGPNATQTAVLKLANIHIPESGKIASTRPSSNVVAIPSSYVVTVTTPSGQQEVIGEFAGVPASSGATASAPAAT